MTTEKINTKEILSLLEGATSEFLAVVSSFNEERINTVPFENSWTAAQVADHVTQSNRSMVQALSSGGKTTPRDIAKGVTKLKELFLNFDAKLQSPKFILPTHHTYKRERIIAELKNSIEQLRASANTVDLSETVSHRVFGDITKLEIVHFVVYHTQRHIHQLKNIFDKIANR